MNKEAYLKAIMNGLNCSKKDKRRIYEDLKNDIDLRLENGEKLEEIIEQMGTPEEMVTELTENMNLKPIKSNKKLFIGIISGVLVIFIVGFIAYQIFIPKQTMLADSNIFDQEMVEKKADEVVHLLDERNIDTVLDMCDDRLRSSLDTEGLLKILDEMNFNGLEKLDNAYAFEVSSVLDGTYATCIVNASYENSIATYTLSFDQDLNLIGLYVK